MPEDKLHADKPKRGRPPKKRAVPPEVFDLEGWRFTSNDVAEEIHRNYRLCLSELEALKGILSGRRSRQIKIGRSRVATGGVVARMYDRLGIHSERGLNRYFIEAVASIAARRRRKAALDAETPATGTGMPQSTRYTPRPERPSRSLMLNEPVRNPAALAARRLKAITLTQPWAEAVARGWKRVETRSWSTPYRGRIAIHAAKGWRAADRYFAVEQGLDPNTLVRGAIVATCRLVDCLFMDRDYLDGVCPEEQRWGIFSPGRYAWVLEDVEALEEPIPAVGHLGLWTIRGLESLL
ncbi:MAG TPA: ASCH domain-containing protein [Terriglobales bacterium]|nr:ASCH domain-containing protein [Terriglobales bacterium]